MIISITPCHQNSGGKYIHINKSFALEGASYLEKRHIVKHRSHVWSLRRWRQEAGPGNSGWTGHEGTLAPAPVTSRYCRAIIDFKPFGAIPSRN